MKSLGRQMPRHKIVSWLPGPGVGTRETVGEHWGLLGVMEMF